MEINKEELSENLKNYFLQQLLDNLEQTDLDDDEKAANVVLAKKKITADAIGIADLVFKVSE
jgi:hypothetical protein